MKHKTSQVLYAYWNEVRGKRLAPRRFEIEPARIGSILPETFILERADDGGFRFRLAGTRIFECLGTELRGTDFLALWQDGDRDQISVQLATLVSKGGVGTIEFDGITADGRSARFEAILLPLVHSAQTIDRIVGAISCAHPPDWIGDFRIDRHRVVAHEVVWPDGRPYAVLAAGERQAPFHPHTRAARLVRSDRRQFRVYDGGLTKPPQE